MKECPYNVAVKQVNQNIREYSADGQEVFHSHTLLERTTPTACKGKDCGAYWRGRCWRTK